MSRRPPSLASEASDAFFRLASGAGLIAGIFWALDHPATPKECTDTSSGALGKCMGDSLWTTIQPYVIGIGVGTIAGAVLATAIILTIRLLGRAPRTRSHASPAPAAARRPVVNAAAIAASRGRSMTARYPGTCSCCRSTIRPGDRITHLGPQNNRCATCA